MLDLYKIHDCTLLSELFSEALVPEISRRVQIGSIKNNELPIEIKTLRVVHMGYTKNKTNYRIEFPYELPQLKPSSSPTISIGFKKQNVSVGKHIIYIPPNNNDTNNSYIEVPRDENGSFRPFIIFHSFDFGFITIVYPENFPHFNPDKLIEERILFPETPYKQLNELADKSILMDILRKYNWPPSTGYYPEVLEYITQNINNINESLLFKSISKKYNKRLFEDRIDFWKATHLFGDRII